MALDREAEMAWLENELVLIIESKGITKPHIFVSMRDVYRWVLDIPRNTEPLRRGKMASIMYGKAFALDGNTNSEPTPAAERFGSWTVDPPRFDLHKG